MIKYITLFVVSAILFGRAQAQKGEKSIAAGLFAAISDNSVTQYDGYEYSWGTGIGLEVIGQSNITDRGALLLQVQATRFKGSSRFSSLMYAPELTPVAVKGGYRYRFTQSGFFANGLLGIEYVDRETYLPLALGVGKRININDSYFVDAGIEFTGGFVSRFNIKAVFGILQKAQER